MMRIVGAVMIAGGSLGLGLWYREQFLGRIRVLYKLQNILELLMSEIRYGKSTLPESCRHIGEREQEPYRTALLEIYARMKENTGATFGQIFGECMEGMLGGLPIHQEDKDIFLAFSREGGLCEGVQQIRSLEQCREHLAQITGGLEQEKLAKCKVAVGLGAMSGLLLIIILI